MSSGGGGGGGGGVWGAIVSMFQFLIHLLVLLKNGIVGIFSSSTPSLSSGTTGSSSSSAQR